MTDEVRSLLTEPRIQKLERIRDRAIQKKKMIATRDDSPFQPEWQKREVQDDILHKIAFFKEAKKKSPFAILKDNRKQLTPEERALVMKRRAVWHMNGGGPSPAVWKSVHPKTGKVTYVTHTHRAYNTAPTVQGAIGRFHKFIKGTA